MIYTFCNGSKAASPPSTHAACRPIAAVPNRGGRGSEVDGVSSWTGCEYVTPIVTPDQKDQPANQTNVQFFGLWEEPKLLQIWSDVLK